MAIKSRQLLVCGLLAFGVAGLARAQSSPPPAQGLIDSRFVFNVGGFILGSDIKARLDGSSVKNPDVDFDKTFGKANDSTRIRADALWRITPTHHLRFMYFDNSNTRSKVIDKDIQWGDYTFHAGADVKSETKFKIAELAYEYAFMRSPTFELAGSAGVHYMDLSAQLSGTATFTDKNGTVSQAAFTTKQGSVPVPLPVFGVRAGWVVAPQWYVDLQGQFFKAKFGEYDARVYDLRAGATWMFSQNFGVGLGYNKFLTSVDVEKDTFNGRVRLSYSGLQLFLTGVF